MKIWSTNQQKSVSTIESKANICCVKFNPENSHFIAFGSAGSYLFIYFFFLDKYQIIFNLIYFHPFWILDHHIHYYDLRNVREPLFVFRGHRKAVSYVKFLNKDEIVSA